MRFPRMRFCVASILLAVAATGAPAQTTGEELAREARAKKLEGRIMAPCCSANPVADHYSPAADKARQDIRTMIAEGRSDQEILYWFVERHGPLILSMPPAEGFNLFAYLGGFVMLFGGGLSLFFLVRWLRTRAPAVAPVETAPAVALNAEDAARLEKELAQFD